MIMPESKPLVLLRKYRSILLSSLAVEIVTFIVSLTDSIVAGNLIGIDAYSAISLFSPFLLISSFIAAVVNTGTMVNYTCEIGLFHQKRAHEFFSQGTLMAVGSGVLITAAVLLLKPLVLSGVSISSSMKDYFSRYYDIAVFYLLLFPVSCVLNNIVVADGGEKHAAIANIACITGNIVLSVLLARPLGVTGVAAATVVNKIGFLILICLWFVKKENTVRFVWHFSLKDLLNMVIHGIVRASKFLSTSVMLWIINILILKHFDTVTFQVWTIDQNILGLSTVFLGISMTLQPLLGTLIGEKNTRAIRFLMRLLSRDIAVIGLMCTLLIWCFTPSVLHLFGVSNGPVFNESITALRITSLTLVFNALLVLFFIYYFLMSRRTLSLIITLLTDLIVPTLLAFLIIVVLHGEPDKLWAGLALSNLLSALIFMGIVLARFKRREFPLLLPIDRDQNIHIFSFILSPESGSCMSATVDMLVQRAGFSNRLKVLTGLCLEDMLNLIAEQNRNASGQVLAEITLFLETEGVRMVLRDNGGRFDILKEHQMEYSFLKYMVDQIVTMADYRAYIATTGYNRYELRFEEKYISD